MPLVVMLPLPSDDDRGKNADVICCCGVVIGAEGRLRAGCGEVMDSVGGTGRRYGSRSLGGLNSLGDEGQRGGVILWAERSGGPDGISFAHAAMPSGPLPAQREVALFEDTSWIVW